MNILILSANANRHKYFACRIIEALPQDNVKVLYEPKNHRPEIERKKGFSKNLKFQIQLKRNRILNRLFKKYQKSVKIEKRKIEIAYFQELADKFDRDHSGKVLATTEVDTTINSDRYIQIVKQFAPDIIVVSGTGLIGDRIISIPKLGALNMHTGLSPYYRGGATNLWPIYNHEPQYCGVTIHVLTTGIDSGNIIYNGLPIIEPSDTYPVLNSKSYQLGIYLMIRAIKDLKENNLRSKSQWMPGKLYNDIDYHGWALKNYQKLISDGVIRDYCKKEKQRRVTFPLGLVLNLNPDIPQNIPAIYRK